MGWKQPIDTEIFEWFGDDHLARDLFLHLLLKARNSDMSNYEHYKGKPFLLNKGQVIFGRNEYSQRLRCSPSGSRKALLRLEKVYSRVTSSSTTDYTVITILNYDDLVGMEQAKEQASDKQVTSRCQAGDTNKSVKSVKSAEIAESVENKNGGKPQNFDEVLDFFKTLKIVDAESNAEKFYNHYEANGWYRGKAKIKSWKACVKTWNFNKVTTDKQTLLEKLK